MTSFPSYLITEELLSSLRKQPVFAEVIGSGIFLWRRTSRPFGWFPGARRHSSPSSLRGDVQSACHRQGGRQ